MRKCIQTRTKINAQAKSINLFVYYFENKTQIILKMSDPEAMWLPK